MGLFYSVLEISKIIFKNYLLSTIYGGQHFYSAAFQKLFVVPQRWWPAFLLSPPSLPTTTIKKLPSVLIIKNFSPLYRYIHMPFAYWRFLKYFDIEWSLGFIHQVCLGKSHSSTIILKSQILGTYANYYLINYLILIFLASQTAWQIIPKQYVIINNILSSCFKLPTYHFLPYFFVDILCGL